MTAAPKRRTPKGQLVGAALLGMALPHLIPAWLVCTIAGSALTIVFLGRSK